MIRAFFYSPDGKSRKDLQLVDIAFALHDPAGYLWVDFCESDAAEDQVILEKTFGFHPLAIDDALQETHVPKLDDWMDYLYIVLHGVAYDKQADEPLDTLELDIFLGKNHMVTHHDHKIDAIERVWSNLSRDERGLKNGPDRLLYRITDELVNSYMIIFDTMDEDIDQIETEVFGHPGSITLEKIYSLKRSVLRLRRIIAPQREVLNKLAREEYDVIDPRDQVYFRDVYDHLVRMQDLTESLRELVSDTMETYLSMVNNRMSEVVKTLTIITTFFMPLSFIASFFGMNFFVPRIPLSEWVEKPVFIFVLFSMLILPVFMYQWFRKRNWM